MKSPGGVSEEDENGVATSDNTHDPGTHGADEVHTVTEAEHDTEVASQYDGDDRTNTQVS